jgi:hypothetical protein
MPGRARGIRALEDQLPGHVTPTLAACALPFRPGCTETCSNTKGRKNKGKYLMAKKPGYAGANCGQCTSYSKVECLGVHSRSRLERGSRRKAAPLARADGLEPCK